MRAKQPPRHKDPARKIERLLGTIEAKLIGDFKFTVGDYIRLLQVHEELEGDTAKDIEVTWVDKLEVSESEK